jgi:N-acetylglucosamine malate deacetylase 1
MNVLVIAPHPDDEAIGCGGSVVVHTLLGHRVVAVFLTSGELGLPHLEPAEARRVRENEALAAGEILALTDLRFLRQPDWFLDASVMDASDALSPILSAEGPDLIYLPHDREWHPDHRASLSIVTTALGQVGLPLPALRAYEVWSPLTAFDSVQVISEQMERKLRAVRAHRSQLHHFRHDRAVQGLNRFRGEIAARSRYAEVFQEPDGDWLAATRRARTEWIA